MRLRMLAILTCLAVVAAACGNSKKDTASSTTVGANGPTATIASATELKKDLPNSSKGVTDKTITVDTITSKTNPLHGHYAELADGVQAYFNMVNSEGGIYGRTLQIGKQRDDIAGLQNQQQAQQAVAQDNAFATFIATLQFFGAQTLQSAGQPTFGWNINAEYGDRPDLFGNESALCNGSTCTGITGSWLAKKAGVTKVGVLAYGVNQSSIDCGKGTVNSFNKYKVAQVAFKDFTIQFAQPDLSAQVAQMKKKGVQMVFTCMDADETLVLAKEMKRQGLNAIQELPNGYDRNFIKANAQYYEGSYVIPQFLALEWEPQIPEIKTFEKWVQAEHKPIYEITVIGWIAAYQFVLGLKLAGPHFTQQKVINGLNTQNDVTVGGLIAAINWTNKAVDGRSPGHVDPTKHPEVRGHVECSNFLRIESGKFVPVFATAAKPWVCIPNNTGSVPDNPPTRTYVNG